MTPPTTEELLRLAREVFPNTDWDALPLGPSGKVTRLAGAVAAALMTVHLGPGCESIVAKQRAALHVALLVLACELDVTDMLEARLESDDLCTALKMSNDERDRYKARWERLNELWCNTNTTDEVLVEIGKLIEERP